MFQFIRSLFGGSIGSAIAKEMPRGVGESLSTPIPIESARRNSTVVACCNVVARLVAQIPFEVHDGNTRARRLLREPNSHQTAYEFKHSIAFDLAIAGNSFVRAVRGPAGRIEALGPLDPETVRVDTDAAGAPFYREIRTNIGHTATDIMHIRDGGGHKLLAPSRLESGGSRIRILIAADNLISETFGSGIHPQYTVTSDDPISRKKAKELGDLLFKLFGKGGERRGGAAVLGNAKLDKVQGLTPADADLRFLRDQIIREIAALWSVPAFLAGAEGDTKYSNHTAQSVALYRDLVAPTAINVGERFSRFLRADIRPKLSAVVAGDFKLASQVASEVAGGPTMTPDEARAHFLMLPPLGTEESGKLRAGRIGQAPTMPGDREGEQPTDDGSTDPNA